MLKYKTIEIQLSECHAVLREVPEWELAVIRVLHGDGAVRVIGDKIVKRDPPEANDEFSRLAKRYHSGKEKDGSPDEVSLVAKVYGSFGIGNKALAAAIAAATLPDPVKTEVDDLVGDVQLSSVGG